MGVTKSPAFQFYPDSWLSSTDIHLMSPAEEGAYIRLLCHSWLQPDCGLPADDDSLAALSRLGKTWPRSADKIRSKFEERDGRIYNARLLEERAKQAKWREKSARGGKHSAAQRQPKDNGGSTTLQPPFNHPCEMVDPLVDEWLQPKGNSPSPSPSPDKTISPKPSWTIDELFVRFSQAYREAKPDSIDEDFTVAYRNWTALDFEQRLSAVDGIKQRVKCGRWSDPKYIPKPRKYLEAEWKRPVLSGDDDEPQYPRVMM